MGTDNRGRDIFARLAYGFRISMNFALLVTGMSYVLGTACGAVLGYFGGRLDIYGQRLLEIFLDVVRERLERRDIEDVDFVRQPPRQPLDDQVVDGGEEGRQRLARPGRGGDQGVTVPRGDRPGLYLRARGRGKALPEPPGDGRVEA